MISRRVTLADVARKADVHVTTVSLALRNHPRLPEHTRTRLQTLAKEMGYAPDPVLQALVAYRGNVKTRVAQQTIAYVTNWQTRWGWQEATAHPDFHRGAESRAHDLGFQLDHFSLREPGLTHGRLSRILYSRGITGMIVSSHMRESDVALHFDWSRFSAIKIDYLPHEPALHNVTNDQCSIIRLAMRRVMAAGYRRIGFVMHRGWDHSVDHAWTAGFLCEQQNLDVADRIPMHLFPGPLPVESWMKQADDVVVDPEPFAAWYRAHRPEVIISKRSFVAPQLEDMRLRVPRDVAFVDVFLDEFTGATAGVRQNHGTVGALAVELLAGQLQQNKFGIPEFPTTTYVEGTWFDGRSLPAR